MDYLELTISTLLSRIRNHESQRFVLRSPAFTAHPHPTITVTCPGLGPSSTVLPKEYTQDGADLFPSLSWSKLPHAMEYVLVIEDVDAPLLRPVTHGLFFGINGRQEESGILGVEDGDLEPLEGTRGRPGEANSLKGGFRFGANIRGTVWSGPRPLMGHGVHRYFYQVVAVGEGQPLEEVLGKGKRVSKEDLAKVLEGRVLGWGEWVGLFERKFQ